MLVAAVVVDGDVGDAKDSVTVTVTTVVVGGGQVDSDAAEDVIVTRVGLGHVRVGQDEVGEAGLVVVGDVVVGFVGVVVGVVAFGVVVAGDVVGGVVFVVEASKQEQALMTRGSFVLPCPQFSTNEGSEGVA